MSVFAVSLPWSFNSILVSIAITCLEALIIIAIYGFYRFVRYAAKLWCGPIGDLYVFWSIIAFFSSMWLAPIYVDYRWVYSDKSDYWYGVVLICLTLVIVGVMLINTVNYFLNRLGHFVLGTVTTITTTIMYADEEEEDTDESDQWGQIETGLAF